MIIQVAFKTPDAIEMAIESRGITDENQKEAIRQAMYRFVEHGEMVTVCFDTTAMSATVERVK